MSGALDPARATIPHLETLDEAIEDLRRVPLDVQAKHALWSVIGKLQHVRNALRPS